MAKGTAGGKTWGQKEPGKECKVHVSPSDGWRGSSRQGQQQRLSQERSSVLLWDRRDAWDPGMQALLP